MEQNVKRLGSIAILVLVLIGGMLLLQTNAVYADDVISINTFEELDKYVDEGESNQTVSVKLEDDIDTDDAMNIYGNITIDLNGHTINRGLTSAKAHGEVFEVESGATLTIKDTSENQEGMITGGYSNNGAGGVHVKKGTFILESGSICENTATDGGGGVLLTKGDDSKFIMTGGSIENNLAKNDDGGAIYVNYGSVKITGGTIQGNIADDGGAIYTTRNKSGILKIKNASFINNSAGKRGGAIDVYDGEATISNCEFSGNHAKTGGAICLRDGDDKITNCTFTGNSASMQGGAIHDKNADSMEVSNCTFTENYLNPNKAYTENVGSAIYIDHNDAVLNNITVTKNITKWTGGAVFAGGNNFTLKGKCIIKDNYTNEVGESDEYSDLVLGGDIYYVIIFEAGGYVEGQSTAEIILNEDLYPGSDIYLHLDRPSVNRTLAKAKGSASASNNVKYLHLTNSGKRAAASGSKIVKKDRDGYKEQTNEVTSIAQPDITCDVDIDNYTTKFSIKNTDEVVDGYETIYYRTTTPAGGTIITSDWMEYTGEEEITGPNSYSYTFEVEAYTTYDGAVSNVTTASVDFKYDEDTNKMTYEEPIYKNGSISKPKIIVTSDQLVDGNYRMKIYMYTPDALSTYKTYYRYKSGDYMPWSDWYEYSGEFTMPSAFIDGYIEAYTTSGKYRSDSRIAMVKIYASSGTTEVKDDEGTIGHLGEKHDYLFVEEAKSPIVKGAEATYVSAAGYSKFKKVQVDDEDVDPDYYTAKEYAKTVSSRTEVTLKGSFTATLSEGEHTISIVSSDGKTTGTFTVVAGVAHEMTEGNEGNFKVTDTIAFAAKADSAEFVALLIDDTAVNADNYAIDTEAADTDSDSSGSNDENISTVVRVTLNKDFVDTLQETEHTVTVAFSDGAATGTFTIESVETETDEDSEGITYRVTEGDGETVFDGDIIAFYTDIPSQKYSGLQVDGKDVNKNDFIMQEFTSINSDGDADEDTDGSGNASEDANENEEATGTDTMILMFADWLSAGKHKVTILANDGKAKTTFTVEEGNFYVFSKGGNSTVIQGNEADFAIKKTGESKFNYVMIDTKYLDESNYSIDGLGDEDLDEDASEDESEEIELQLTLSSDYTKTLEKGYHTISFIMDDGVAAGLFLVKASAEDVIEKEHEYTQVITPATQSEDGNIRYVCSICRDSYSEAIAKIDSIELSDTSYTYDGEEKNPTLTIKDSEGKSLVEGDDYTVTVPEGRTSAGKYTYEIEFKGNYEGSASLEFEIVSDEDPTDNPTVDQKTLEKATLSATSYTYDGTAKEPKVTVLDADGNTVDASNYSVAYKNNKNVGTATVVVTGTGDFAESNITKTFTIKPAKTSITKLSKARKAFTVKWSKKSTQVTGYQIQYSRSSKFTGSTTKTAKVTSYKTTSKKIKKLKAKKKYYVRVRTYKTVSGKTYYSDWSSAKSVKTR